MQALRLPCALKVCAMDEDELDADDHIGSGVVHLPEELCHPCTAINDQNGWID